MRAWLSITVFACLTGSAAAQSDTAVVVVGPAITGNVSASDAKAVRDATVRAAKAPAADRKLETACAADAVCLTGVGVELKVRRLIALTVTPAGRELAVTISLVDVEGKELVAKRAVSIKPKKVASELEAAVAKFLADAPVERAKALFNQGNQHFNLGEFQQALAFYTRAYRIKPLPGFLFNIAQCHRKLGNFQEAITTYQSFLATHPDASNRKVVESLMKEAQDQLALQQKQALEKAADEGKREAERRAAEIQRAAEERKAREAEAKAAGERRAAEEARIEAELEKTYDRHPARKWTIVTGALGAGLLVTGGVFGLGARSAQQSFHDAGCGDPDVLIGDEQFQTCLADRDRGQRNAQLSNILLIGGGVVVGVSVVVFLIDPGNRERPAKPRASVTVSPSAAHLVVQW